MSFQDILDLKITVLTIQIEVISKTIGGVRYFIINNLLEIISPSQYSKKKKTKDILQKASKEDEVKDQKNKFTLPFVKRIEP